MPVSNSRDTILLERRYAAVFTTITDESIAALAAAVDEKLRDALAKVLALPAGTFDDAATVAPKVREAMKARKAYLDTGVLFGEAATEKAIEVLGDKSEDPSLEDLNNVLPKLIEDFSLDACRLMAVQFSVSLGGFRTLGNTDTRFAIPSTGGTASAPVVAPTKDAAAQEDKKRAPAERKEKDKSVPAQPEAQRRAARGRA